MHAGKKVLGLTVTFVSCTCAMGNTLGMHNHMALGTNMKRSKRR